MISHTNNELKMREKYLESIHKLFGEDINDVIDVIDPIMKIDLSKCDRSFSNAKDGIKLIKKSIKDHRIGLNLKESIKKLNFQIEQGIETLSNQHKMLLAEEQAIKEFKSKESEIKMQEETKYEEIVKKLKKESECYQRIRQSNKEKREFYHDINEQVQLAKSELNNLEKQIHSFDSSLLQEKERELFLIQRRQALRASVETIRSTESAMEQLRSESIVLTREEERLKAEFDLIETEKEKKRESLKQMICCIESSQVVPM